MFQIGTYAIALSSLGLALWLSACAAPTPDRPAENDLLPTPPAELSDRSSRQAPIVVEDVQVNVLESRPIQLVLEIEGYIPDGCEVPVTVAQTRAANTIRVTLARELPAEQACTAIVRPYSQQLRLDERLPPGTYRIEVNDFSVTQDLS